MPIFEYVCRTCSNRFEVLVQGSRAAVCPGCNGTDLEQQFSVFAVGRGQTSTVRSSAGACGTCGDPRGPGACSLN